MRKTKEERALEVEKMKGAMDFVRVFQPKSVYEIQEMLKDLMSSTLKGMLEVEMDEHLRYHKYGRSENENSRNTVKNFL